MYHSLGPFLFKVPVKNKIHINQSERVNQFLKIEMLKPSHWALREIPSQIKAKIDLEWELSTGHIVSRDKQYTVLVCTSTPQLSFKGSFDKNPAIISFNDYQLGVQFEINPAQAPTVQILNNFISYQISNLNQNRNPKPEPPSSQNPDELKSGKVKFSVEYKSAEILPQLNRKSITLGSWTRRSHTQ